MRSKRELCRLPVGGGTGSLQKKETKLARCPRTKTSCSCTPRNSDEMKSGHDFMRIWIEAPRIKLPKIAEAWGTSGLLLARAILLPLCTRSNLHWQWPLGEGFSHWWKHQPTNKKSGCPSTLNPGSYHQPSLVLLQCWDQHNFPTRWRPVLWHLKQSSTMATSQQSRLISTQPDDDLAGEGGAGREHKILS